jgi:hypothetical protein
MASRKGMALGIGILSFGGMAFGIPSAMASTAHSPMPTPTPSVTTPAPVIGLPNCGVIRSPRFRELNGRNCLELTFQGNTFYYPVNLTEFGHDIMGSLRDDYLPGTLTLHGIQVGNAVVLFVTYPGGDPQGTRAFVGTITSGHLSGNWDETGTEDGTGTWELVNNV